MFMQNYKVMALIPWGLEEVSSIFLGEMRVEVRNTIWMRTWFRSFCSSCPICFECFGRTVSTLICFFVVLLAPLMADPRVGRSFYRIRWSLVLPYWLRTCKGWLLPKVPARGFSCLWRAKIWIGFRARWPQKGRNGSSQPPVRRNHVEHPFITTGMGFDSTRIRTNYASVSQLATL
jgi:hypothetical protein